MVTKSGGEQWRGRTTFAWLGDATQTQNIDDDLLRYGFRPETNSRGFRLRRQRQRRRSGDRQEAAHVRLVPRLARARQHAGGVLDAGARQDRHHVGPRQRQLPDQRQEPADRPLLAPVLQEAQPLPDTRRTCSVQESTSNEDDVFDIYQVLWNSVVTQKFFVDARVGLNKIFFPTYLNGNDQTLLDSATSIRTRNDINGHRALARSLPGQRHRPVLPGRVAGRPARIQVRLRLRALAGREPHDALRRRRHDLQQRDRRWRRT